MLRILGDAHAGYGLVFGGRVYFQPIENDVDSMDVQLLMEG
jgi:hypothetical protein